MWQVALKRTAETLRKKWSQSAISIDAHLVHRIRRAYKGGPECLVPMARNFGVELDSDGENSWAMSCWIALAQGSKAHWKMPTERLG